MSKKVVFWVILLVLLSSQVYALDPITVSHTNLKSTILQDGTAVFFLKITNNQPFKDTFRVEKPSVYWDWFLDSESVTLQNTESNTSKMEFTPISPKEPGDYGISLDIVSLENSSVRTSELFEIKVVSFDQALLTELISSSNINPNEENLFRVNVKNNYDIIIRNLTFTLSNEYFSENREITIRPFETIELAIPVEFEGIVEDGDNPIFLRFFHDRELVVQREETINIGYFTDVKGIGTPEESFLYNRDTISRTNEGNTISSETYVKRISFFEKFFTTTSPEPTRITRENSNYIYTWNFELTPDETKTIVIATDYRRFTLLAVLFILLVAGLYYWMKRDISLEKRVVSMRKRNDGYYSLNVMLTLKNKTLKNIRNIKIMDRLGGRVEETSNFGTIHPTVFRTSSGKSTKLVWNIPILNKRDEIILHYTMRYKPHIIRSVPSAIAKYLRRGRPVFVRSNRAEIF